jgi:hypothetical protein
MKMAAQILLLQRGDGKKSFVSKWSSAVEYAPVKNVMQTGFTLKIFREVVWYKKPWFRQFKMNQGKYRGGRVVE